MPVGHFALVTNYKSDSAIYFVTLYRENRASWPDSEAALKAGNFRGSDMILMKLLIRPHPAELEKLLFR